MALIQFFQDDLDQTKGEDVKPRVIQLPDGVLKLDLSEANYRKVSDAMVKAVQRIVKTETFDKFFVEGADGPVSENALIRKWASEQHNEDGTPKFEVSVKGRVAADIVAAYRKSLADAASKDSKDSKDNGNANATTDTDENANADKASEAIDALVNA